MPGRVHRQKPVDIHHLPQPALRDGILQRQKGRREAKLEIDGGLQAPGPQDADDPVGLGQVGPHGFLDDADGPLRKRLQKPAWAAGGVARS